MNEIQNTGREKTLIRQWVAAALGGEAWAQIDCRGQSWGLLQFGRAITGAPLCLHGRTHERGLGTHAHSEIVVRLPRPGRRLAGLAGVDDNPDSRAHGAMPNRMEFTVETAGATLWRSPRLGVADAPAAVEADLGGATEFTLRVREVHDAIGYAHADWVDLRVVLDNGDEVAVGGTLEDMRCCARPPIGFVYGTRPAADLLPGWEFSTKSVPAPAGATGRLACWKDPQTGLECEVEAVEFAEFAAVEWVARFRNTGTVDTPILEGVQALDLAWAGHEPAIVLHRSHGSTQTIHDFLYRSDPLEPRQSIRMTSGGGRSSSEWLPFFNLQSGGGGLMLAVGWTGSWAAEFSRDAGACVRVTAGMERTRLVLRPGETIRTPRMLLLYYESDPLRGHNLLRRFMLRHHTPSQGGQAALPPVCAATWGGMESVYHLQQIADIRAHRLAYDYYWIDAGWYGPAESVSPDVYQMQWMKYVGHWAVNPAAHPHGLKPLADAAHAAGLKFLLWFEPERALTGTPWTVEHPEWFLGERKPGANLLFNLGEPAARHFLTEFISNFIRDVGLDCYRQDFNFDPLPYWRAADAPDRQGITEIRHIEGLYAFWDELRRRHPGLLIDNCASGGRRIDLETTGRSIPLWRSDHQCTPDFDPAGAQVQTHGLAHWLPLHGGGTCGGQHDPRRGDTYNVRSNLSASLAFPIYVNQGDGRPDHPWEWQRRMITDYRRARPLFSGDYYPLTGCSAASDIWVAMQFDRPDTGEGLVLAFRRSRSPFVAADFPLRALDPAATYAVEDADTGDTGARRGETLMLDGLRIAMDEPRSSRLVFYRRVDRNMA